METMIESWIDLQQKLFLCKPSGFLERYRSPYAFRGLTDSSYPLTTSLLRLNQCWTVDRELEKIEEKLLVGFQMYAPQHTESMATYWDWLFLAQHHGLPTRLLDWTWSPYVALHFATANLGLVQADTDAVIWCVNVRAAHDYLPDGLVDILADAGTKAFYGDKLSRAAHDLRELGSLAQDDFVMFVEPPSIDGRIVNQFALFSVMSTPRGRLDRWLEARAGPYATDRFPLYNKLIIPRHLKWEIRDKLDGANITERMLFPGLDGLAAWIKRHYSCGPLAGMMQPPDDQ
jgi:hypothetical protein